MSRTSYDEAAVDQAIQLVQDGVPHREAPRKTGVPLSNRILGTQPHNDASSSQQRLKPYDEAKLATGILQQESLGLAPTHAQVRFFVSQILERQGDIAPLGKK